MNYDYERCCSEMREFASVNAGAQLFSIGESVMERKIYCISFGEGELRLFLNGAHHGLEYITSAFLMRFLREYARCLADGEQLLGYDVRRLYEKTALYVVPMVNPDGVDIALNGLDITNPYHRRLISMVGIHSFSRVWQANADGVDINHNYDANWSRVEGSPAPSKYGGAYAESEPETQAVTGFVRNGSFDLLMAFHSQGGEIYYDFDGMAEARSREMAEKMSEQSGYPVCTPTGSAAFGGCKDWFIKEFGKSGFTIEMGHGRNPLPVEKLDEFFEENAKIVLCAMQEIAQQS